MVGVRRHGQPQQTGAVQEPDGEDLVAPAPRPDRRRGRVGTMTPEPAHVAGVQLHRCLVVLPLPQRVEGIVQAA